MSRTKTPADMQAWAGANADAGAAFAGRQGDGASTGFDPAALMGQLMGEFDAVLAANPSIDREMREQLQGDFSRALEDAAATAASATASIPDRASWSDTVQALQDNGAIGGEEANELIRTFDASLQPLERRESRVALEFARLLATEGEEKALAWFRTQAMKASAGTADTSAAGGAQRENTGAALRSEVVNARSHRLRGPPRR
ncbi:hypothetical protein ACW5F0_05385 [Luteimonas sp. A534]